MSKKLLNDNIKLILIILLHIVLYLGGSFIVENADRNSIAIVVGIFTMALFSIILPLYLLSRWMVQWRILKLAVILFFVSDIVINLIPYLHFVEGEDSSEIAFSFVRTLMQLLKMGLFTYGLAYYLIVRQERKLMKDSQTAYYDDENN